MLCRGLHCPLASHPSEHCTLHTSFLPISPPPSTPPTANFFFFFFLLISLVSFAWRRCRLEPPGLAPPCAHITPPLFTPLGAIRPSSRRHRRKSSEHQVQRRRRRVDGRSAADFLHPPPSSSVLLCRLERQATEGNSSPDAHVQ